jgi:large subunit ribosomal protein L47
VTGTPDHGLWDFFKDQKLLQTPVDEQRHGRLQLDKWRDYGG